MSPSISPLFRLLFKVNVLEGRIYTNYVFSHFQIITQNTVICIFFFSSLLRLFLFKILMVCLVVIHLFIRFEFFHMSFYVFLYMLGNMLNSKIQYISMLVMFALSTEFYWITYFIFLGTLSSSSSFLDTVLFYFEQFCSILVFFLPLCSYSLLYRSF